MLFPHHADVGDVRHAGDTTYDAESGRYTVTGAGYNMWFARDAFHFAWVECDGDLRVAADVAFVGEGVDPHRKAALLIRQGLEPGAVYADAALHGDGLLSLQFRATPNGPTQEVQASVRAPKRIALERRGDFVRLWADGVYTGCAALLEGDGPWLVGLGVCSHNDDVLESATFADVSLEALPTSDSPGVLHSALETIAIGSGDRRVRFVTPTHIEAPNWTPDGAAWIYNSGGRIWRLPVDGGAPAVLDTGLAVRCNNDHGITPDGQRLIVSDHAEIGASLIYTLPIGGGAPTRVTETGPSYWHGVSPDGTTLAYCAQRDGEFDIYTIPIDGGEETRLTDAPGLSDGPEYSPDGAWIYFNSERTGGMRIWRMRPDGSGQEQVTDSGTNDWFAHPSPDGRWIVYLAYGPEVTGHPPEKIVELKLREIATGATRTLARFFGGQGTINVPSWSPDSRQFAFVTYQRIP